MSVSTSVDYRTSYETVAISQTDQVLGVEGGAGDVLQRLIITVATAATATCSIKDGAGSAILITVANTPIGVYSVELGVKADTNWKVSTGAGCTVLAVGRFK